MFTTLLVLLALLITSGITAYSAGQLVEKNTAVEIKKLVSNSTNKLRLINL